MFGNEDFELANPDIKHETTVADFLHDKKGTGEWILDCEVETDAENGHFTFVDTDTETIYDTWNCSKWRVIGAYKALKAYQDMSLEDAVKNGSIKDMKKKSAKTTRLHEADDEGKEKKEKEDEKAAGADPKTAKKEILAGLKGMRPGEMLMAITKSTGSTVTDFLATHVVDMIVNAVKSGKVKADAIKDAVKGFGKKNKADNTKIDWENVELDPSTMTFTCMFEGDVKKQLDEFMKVAEKELKPVAKEAEKADKQLAADVKKAKVEVSDEDLKENSIQVANAIDSEDAKDKKPEEIGDDIKAAIEAKKQLQDMMKQCDDSSKKLKSADWSKVSKKDLETVKNETEAESKKAAEESTEGKAAKGGDDSALTAEL